MPAARASMSTFSRMNSVSVPVGVQRKPMSPTMSPKRDTAPPMYETRSDAVAIS